MSINAVVVGVSGSPRDDGALRAGVDEAHRLGVGVHLVHVVPEYLPVSPLFPAAPSALDDTGAGIIRAAERLVHDLDPEIEVAADLAHGPRARRLAEAAESAPVLVVGRDDRFLTERLLRGNTATGAAAAASCPVLVVPVGWRPAPGTGSMLVGVKSPAHAAELLGDAFAVAAQRGDRVIVLHAWKLPHAYDDIIESRVAVDDWTQKSTNELGHLIKDWRTAYPQVDVEIRIVHAHPAAALVETSRDADTLVIVRRRRGVPAAAHLGGTARSVLRLAHCPVRVVPATDGLGALPGLVVEDEGTLIK